MSAITASFVFVFVFTPILEPGEQTQVIMIVRQAFYQLGCLYSPHCHRFNEKSLRKKQTIEGRDETINKCFKGLLTKHSEFSEYSPQSEEHFLERGCGNSRAAIEF